MLLLITLLVFLTVTACALAILQWLTRDQERVRSRVRAAISAAQSWADQGGRSAFEGGWSTAAEVAAGLDAARWERGRRLVQSLARLFESQSLAKAAEREIQRAGLPLRGSEFVAISLISAVAFSFLGYMLGSVATSLAGFSVGLVLPRAWLRLKAAARLKAFNAQITDALTMISGSLKAGYSFMQAMEMVAREMPAPICDEFRRSLREMSLGAPVEESLKSMAERVASDDLDLVVTAVLIQRQVGGNLAEVLDKIAHTVRERIRIKGEVKTLTAQGRISGVIVALLPIGIGGFVALVNPGYMQPLFATPVGRLMIGLSIMGQIVGAFMIKKVVTIEV